MKDEEVYYKPKICEKSRIMANLAYGGDDSSTQISTAFDRLHSHSGRKSEYFVELKRLMERDIQEQ